MEAVVHEDGTAVGLAFLDGALPSGVCGLSDQIPRRQVLALVSSAGDARLLREWEGAPCRVELGLVVGEAVALVRIGDEWWSLSLAAPRAELVPMPDGPYAQPDFAPSGARWPLAPEECAVSGTPLRLLTWDRNALLVDAQRTPVWFERFGEPIAGASWAPGIFAVGVGRRSRAFRVELMGSWSVSYLPEPQVKRELDELETLEAREPARTFALTLGDGSVHTTSEPCDVLVDPLGRVAVLERKAGRMRIFGEAGILAQDLGLEAVMRPGDRPLYRQPLAVDASGAWILSLEGHGCTPRVRIQADGRIVPGEFTEEVTDETLTFVPGTDARWVLGRRKLFRVDALGRHDTPVLRRPDGAWFGLGPTMTAAPDGSLAVLDGAELHLYGPDGVPLHSFAVPQGHWGFRPAFDGRRAALLTKDALVVVDTSSGRIVRVPMTAGWNAGVFFSRRGDELWVVDPVHGVVRCYAWP